MTQFSQRQLEQQRMYNQYIQSGDMDKALAYLDQVLSEFPTSELRSVRPSCLKAVGRYAEACREAEALLTTEMSTLKRINLWDVLAEACALTNRLEEAADYGRLSLQAKSELPPTAMVQALPETVQMSSKPERSGAWVIAFSLYGDEPRYGEGAVLNVVEAKKWLPDWVCRFYCDSSVPSSVIVRLLDAGAQVHFVNSTCQKKLAGTFWRMLVVDDPTVERFLQRDADSIISEREALAVNEWVQSERFFHTMRDWWSHSELLLAGMWGGCTVALSGMGRLIRDFLTQHPHWADARTVDQLFLRTSVWPTVRQSLISHDDYFGFDNAKPFPAHGAIWQGVFRNFHVGMNTASCPLEVPSNLADGMRVHWMIRDGEREICRYSSVVRHGLWRTALPQQYFRPLVDKVWHVYPQDNPSAPYALRKPREVTATTRLVIGKK